ncbi:MAG: hypothetical protein N3D79_06470 [Acidilobaceae archaeon]|nr:hypothetical protein [Acidilobaceae archaeon]
MKRVREIAWSVSKRYSERNQLLSVIMKKAKAVEKMLESSVKKTEKWRKINEELSMLTKEIAKIEEEILRREGMA